MPRGLITPFPEFERWRWNGDRDLPKTDPAKTSIKRSLPEREAPPDWGFTYEQYRDDVAKWSAEKLNGELACLEANVRANTMPVAMFNALIEAKEARREELAAYKLEYSKRNKLFLWEDVNKMDEKKRKREAEEVGPHGETSATHDRVTEKHKTGGKGQLVTAVHWVKREPSTGA